EVGDERRDVATDGHEARVAQGKLPGVAIDDVERNREDDVDPDQNQDAVVVGDASNRNGRQREGKRDQDRHADRQLDDVAQPPRPHQTFSFWYLPKSPEGRKSRISTRTTNAIASR